LAEEQSLKFSILEQGSGYFTSRGKIGFKTTVFHEFTIAGYITWHPHVIVVYECVFVQVAGVAG